MQYTYTVKVTIEPDFKQLFDFKTFVATATVTSNLEQDELSILESFQKDFRGSPAVPTKVVITEGK